MNKPKRTKSNILGDKGELKTQEIINDYNWDSELIKNDYGEDLHCTVFIDEFRTEFDFRCQVKSSNEDSRYVKKLKNGDLSVSIKTSILNSWIDYVLPVFIIVYDESENKCYWTNPKEQILNNINKLNQKTLTIKISHQNIFDIHSKSKVFDEIKTHYEKVLRLDEFVIQCNVIPLLMPSYRVIPFVKWIDFIESHNDLEIGYKSELIETLPSWASVIKKIDPSPFVQQVSFSSSNTDLEVFLSQLLEKLNTFKYKINDNEWLGFIISPVKLISKSQNNWEKELTNWSSYIKIKDKLINDFTFGFKMIDGLIELNATRSMSWEKTLFIHKKMDITVKVFSGYEVTPIMQNINNSHINNIKSQFIVWECFTKDIDVIINILEKYELKIELLEENVDISKLVISTPFFNLDIGLYNLPDDWEKREENLVNHLLKLNKVILPGKELKDNRKYIENFFNLNFIEIPSNMLISEENYIDGLPNLLNHRLIKISRFNSLSSKEVRRILDFIDGSSFKNYQFELNVRDDMYEECIYELSVYLEIKDIEISTNDYFLIYIDEIVHIFDDIMPTSDNRYFKCSYDCLLFAGQMQ